MAFSQCISLKETNTESYSCSSKKSALLQVIAWRQTGDKRLHEAMMTQFDDAYTRHLISDNTHSLISAYHELVGNYAHLITQWEYHPIIRMTLQWRHNERDGVPNHRRLNWLPKHMLRHRSKKSSTLRVTGLCEGNSPVTGEIPTQRARKAENVSIWWRHHDLFWHKRPKYIVYLCEMSRQFIFSFSARVKLNIYIYSTFFFLATDDW